MRRTTLWIVGALAVCLTIAACTSWQKGVDDVNIHGEDIIYLRDNRTKLCFAVLYLGNKVGTSVADMSMTAVPCENLENAPVR